MGINAHARVLCNTFHQNQLGAAGRAVPPHFPSVMCVRHSCVDGVASRWTWWSLMTFLVFLRGLQWDKQTHTLTSRSKTSLLFFTLRCSGGVASRGQHCLSSTPRSHLPVWHRKHWECC